jgi:hypothetical protein
VRVMVQDTTPTTTRSTTPASTSPLLAHCIPRLASSLLPTAQNDHLSERKNSNVPHNNHPIQISSHSAHQHKYPK